MTTLTLDYERIEDRMTLWVRELALSSQPAQTQAGQQLWLTRRLVMGVLDLLAGLLQQASMAEQAPSRLPGDLARAWQEDRLALEHRQALQQVRQKQAADDETPAGEATEAAADFALPPEPLETARAYLVNRLDATWQQELHAVQLAWYAADALVCQFSLPRTELHWFMDRLCQLSRQADWSAPWSWPVWLQNEENAQERPVSMEPAVVLH